MPCQYNEQCSHTPHALCIQGICGCTEGYFAYSSTGCLKGVHVNVIYMNQKLCLA